MCIKFVEHKQLTNFGFYLRITSFVYSGMVASLTSLPVIGVPIKTSTLSGFDSLLSIVQVSVLSNSVI
jgi:hypothetical protein